MPLVELTPAVFLQSALVMLIICLPLLDQATTLRHLRQFTSSAARLSAFRWAIASLWGIALLAIVLASPANLFVVRPANADLAWLLNSPVTLAVAIALLTVYFGLAFAPSLHCAMDPKARQKYWNETRSLRFLLPVSDSERRCWVLVSITAGVCEEVVFRGFLPQFLQGTSHGGWHLDLTAAWLLSSLLFGCGHCYQGAAGVARTTLAGLLFGLLAIVSGSLLLPIALHVLVDVVVLWVYRPQLDNPDAAARLVRGCDPMLASVDMAP